MTGIDIMDWPGYSLKSFAFLHIQTRYRDYAVIFDPSRRDHFHRDEVLPAITRLRTDDQLFLLCSVHIINTSFELEDMEVHDPSDLETG